MKTKETQLIFSGDELPEARFNDCFVAMPYLVAYRIEVDGWTCEIRVARVDGRYYVGLSGNSKDAGFSWAPSSYGTACETLEAAISCGKEEIRRPLASFGIDFTPAPQSLFDFARDRAERYGYDTETCLANAAECGGF